MLHQEALFKKTLNHLKEKPTEQNMFTKFLEVNPKEWKQLKIAFSKFNKSKQYEKTIPPPKPEVLLRKEIRIWLKSQV